jgi:hypothetical protein
MNVCGDDGKVGLASRLSNTAGAEGLVSCLDGGLLHQAQKAPNILDVAGRPVLPVKGSKSGIRYLYPGSSRPETKVTAG